MKAEEERFTSLHQQYRLVLKTPVELSGAAVFLGSLIYMAVLLRRRGAKRML